ncbi:Uncharacterised protein [Vibrio cholerae]|nr:Uncharacterised protein [Vibrio cholerae]CSI44019.1 Uncharacterised protein [Vibrio cholerae]CSI73878.1 Uncharacterised protein [Vibrio cholerae]
MLPEFLAADPASKAATDESPAGAAESWLTVDLA